MIKHKLEAKNLKKRYKNRTVVENVSLGVEEGQIVGLLGPNGAGKTTCFYMIVGLVPSDGGQVLIDDLDLAALPMHQRALRGIGYLPQEPSIFRKLTVEQNILAILELRKDLNKTERQEQLELLLNEFRIPHIRRSLGIALSGGERRRVEIARAVAANPRFMLLDEPFAGVDPISVNDIKQIIHHLANRHIGILITDHNVRETLDICEKAYIVGQGHVIAEGTPAEVLADANVKATYLGESFIL